MFLGKWDRVLLEIFISLRKAFVKCFKFIKKENVLHVVCQNSVLTSMLPNPSHEKGQKETPLLSLSVCVHDSNWCDCSLCGYK